MIELKQTETFRKWRAKLKDERARVHLQRRGSTIIVLLCGVDKGSQDKDIKTAKRLAAEWSAEP